VEIISTNIPPRDFTRIKDFWLGKILQNLKKRYPMLPVKKLFSLEHLFAPHNLTTFLFFDCIALG